jgi:type IX secretion system PorP/SprF family membrane protein
LGAGLSLIHDKLGYERTTFLYADVSYTVYMNKGYRLSFGFKAGLSKYGLDSDLLTDPSAIGDQYLDRIFNRWKPNFGAGVYYRSDDWFMSFSAPRILSYNNRTDIEYAAIERVSYYLSGGYMLDFNLHLKFKPTFLVKFTNGAPPSVDLTGNFLIKDTLWLGLSYRVGDALGGLATIEANKNLKFGYAYEFNTTALNPYTSGSHEIFMIYSFDYPRTKCDCENKF